MAPILRDLGKAYASISLSNQYLRSTPIPIEEGHSNYNMPRYHDLEYHQYHYLTYRNLVLTNKIPIPTKHIVRFTSLQINISIKLVVPPFSNKQFILVMLP